MCVDVCDFVNEIDDSGDVVIVVFGVDDVVVFD